MDQSVGPCAHAIEAKTGGKVSSVVPEEPWIARPAVGRELSIEGGATEPNEGEGEPALRGTKPASYWSALLRTEFRRFKRMPDERNRHRESFCEDDRADQCNDLGDQ
jgi:hypothetical protein